MTYLVGQVQLEVVSEIGSTQDEIRTRIDKGSNEPCALLALHQTKGRGRLQRTWHSEPGSVLALSVSMPHLAHHPKPWLIGFAWALLAAERIDVSLQWPNDLVHEGRKVGGILTELHDGIPIVGLGINLSIGSFPDELTEKAISLDQIQGEATKAEDLAKELLASAAVTFSPQDWSDIREAWMVRDVTPGKHYRSPKGEEITADHIGSSGQLVGRSNGQRVEALAAEAIFGQNQS